MDYLTYCTDTSKLLKEVKEKYPDLVSNTMNEPDEGFEEILILVKTPTVRRGSNTVSLVRDLPMPDLTSLKILLKCRNFKAFNMKTWTGPNRDLYDSVYVREYEYTDLDGQIQSGLKPEKIGVFA